VFIGKFIENQRKQKDIKIAGTKEQAMCFGWQQVPPNRLLNL
jgi:hypothetical protein